jgi:hypothetical protein
MKVIIAGSRKITDPAIVLKVIEDSGYNITEVVSGKAKGVDTIGEAYANINDIPVKSFPAEWEKYNKKTAGPIRNREMALYADAAIIIWDGISTGTHNMIQNMKRVNKPYFLVTIKNQ